MIHENRVTRDDTRAYNGGRGTPDKCFYCPAPIGAPHEPKCVRSKRTVVLEAKIEMVVEVPASWTEESILFQRNDSSWCIGNLKDELEAGPDCLCPYTEFSFVREATEIDEENWAVK